MDYSSSQTQDSTESIESDTSLDNQRHIETPISIDFGSLTLSPLTLSDKSDIRPTVEGQVSSISAKENRLPPPATYPGSAFTTPTFLRRRSLAQSLYFARPSTSSSRKKSSKSPNLNKPLPALQSAPSYMQVTPPHLRRPGPSAGNNAAPAASKSQRRNDKRSSFLPKFHTQVSSHRTSFSMSPKKSQNAASTKTITNTANIVVAVRVRPVPTTPMNSKHVPQYLLTSSSSRPCLFIENGNDHHRKLNLGLGSIRKRQQNTLTSSEKSENQSSSIPPSSSPVDVSESYASSSKRIFVTLPQTTQGGTNTTRGFTSFDYVFSDLTTQKHLYSTCVAPLIRSFLNSGTDVSLIACGQAKSGKSYTLGTLGILDGILDETLDFGGKFSEEVFREMFHDGSKDVQGLENEVDLSRDGILIRALDDIFGKTANSLRSVTISYVEIGTRVVPTGLEETAFDLLQNQKLSQNDADAEHFWDALAKVSVTSTEEAIRTLLKAKGNLLPKALAEEGGHLLIGIHVGKETEKKSRLIIVDSIGSDKLAQLDGKSEILNDVRFLSTQTLLFATVSAQPNDASETMATLMLAERARNVQDDGKENKLKQKSSVKRDRKNDNGKRRSKLETTAHGNENNEDLRSNVQPLQDNNLRLKRESISSKNSNAADLNEQKTRDRIDANDDDDLVQKLQSEISMLRGLLKGERLSFSQLEHRLVDAQSDLTLAQQAMESAVERERSMRLDLCALKGSLMSMARDQDAGQMELRKARACEEAARDKWLALESECEILKWVISDMEGSVHVSSETSKMNPLDQDISSEENLTTEGSRTSLIEEEPPFVEILTDLANRLARSQRQTEKLQKGLEEQQAISAKIEWRAEKEKRSKEKLMRKLELVRGENNDAISVDLSEDGEEEGEGNFFESSALLNGTALSKTSSVYRRASSSQPSEDYLKLLDSRINASSAAADSQLVSSVLPSQPVDKLDMQKEPPSSRLSAAEELEAEAEWDAIAVQLDRNELVSQQSDRRSAI